MSIDPQIKFTRARKGYDPKEVDITLDEMQEEIADLRQQNRRLSEAIAQYNTRIERFEGGSKLLEQEQASENQRLETIRDWFEQMEAARNTLIITDRDLHTVSENLLSKVETLIDKMTKDMQSVPATTQLTQMYKPKLAADGASASHNGSTKDNRSKTTCLHSWRAANI